MTNGIESPFKTGPQTFGLMFVSLTGSLPSSVYQMLALAVLDLKTSAPGISFELRSGVATRKRKVDSTTRLGMRSSPSGPVVMALILKIGRGPESVLGNGAGGPGLTKLGAVGESPVGAGNVSGPKLLVEPGPSV